MRWLITLVLLVTVTPAVPELVENAAHVLVHADLAHGGHEAPDGAAGDEHGCTPLFHACGCHAAMSASPLIAVVPPRARLRARVLVPPAAADRLGRSEEPPPLRPPIA